MLFNLESSRLYRTRRAVGAAGHDARNPTTFEPQSTDATTGVATAGTTKHYTLPAMPAPCSLLESYVTGTGSPLRNLYCQCKHHHDSLQ